MVPFSIGSLGENSLVGWRRRRVKDFAKFCVDMAYSRQNSRFRAQIHTLRIPYKVTHELFHVKQLREKMFHVKHLAPRCCTLLNSPLRWGKFGTNNSDCESKGWCGKNDHRRQLGSVSGRLRAAYSCHRLRSSRQYHKCLGIPERSRSQDPVSSPNAR